MSKPSQHVRSRGMVWLLAACTLLAAAWWQRDALADRLFPAARAQALERRAQQALDAGRLSRADGEGARELYEAAIAIDPDRLAPRQGLSRVAMQALADAERAIADSALDEARRALALAETLQAPRGRIAAVREHLRRRDAQRLRTGDLLRRAAEARRGGRLVDGAAAALPLYAQVLSADPRNVAALEGREDALDDLLAAALQRMREGDLAEAATAVAAARGYDPGHDALPAAEDALQQSRDAMRQQVERDVSAGRLQAARTGLDQLRRSGPDAPVDAAATRRLARAYAAQAVAAAQAGKRDAAGEAAQAARALAADDAEVLQATRPILQPPPRQRRRPAATDAVSIDTLLRRAREARSAGLLTLPADASAVHWLQLAQDAAPRDARVRSEARLLDAALQRCHAGALQRNALARADACLDGRLALATEASRLADVRRRHAGRWLAVAEERLRGGDVPGARDAWRAARRRDPDVPGLQAFARRLRTAERATR